MSLSFRLDLDNDGNFTWRTDVPDGETAFNKNLVGVLTHVVAQAARNPDMRLPTLSEVAALAVARAIPAGWAPTADGVNVTLQLGDGGGRSYSRNWQRGGETGPVLTAPCDESGNATPATRDALLAYDREHPAPPPPAEA